MSEIGYYPGCSLRGTAAEYDRSLRTVAARLDVQLREVPDWVCCGATSAHAIDPEAAVCLAADTLAKARSAGIETVLAPCAMCHQRLASARHDLAENAELSRRVAEALGTATEPPIHGMQVSNLLDWLGAFSDEAIKAQVRRPLTGVKVACYYGCLLVRPPKLTGAAEVETPRAMQRTVALLGATPVRWSMATECCGASFALSRKQVVLRLGRRIYDAARKAGADVVCLACPMCQANLDMRQAEMSIESSARLPALYLTQLMGLAFGVAEQELGLSSHFVPFDSALLSRQSELQPAK